MMAFIKLYLSLSYAGTGGRARGTVAALRARGRDVLLHYFRGDRPGAPARGCEQAIHGL